MNMLLSSKHKKRYGAIWTIVSILAIIGMVIYLIIPVFSFF